VNFGILYQQTKLEIKLFNRVKVFIEIEFNSIFLFVVISGLNDFMGEI